MDVQAMYSPARSSPSSVPYCGSPLGLQSSTQGSSGHSLGRYSSPRERHVPPREHPGFPRDANRPWEDPQPPRRSPRGGHSASRKEYDSANCEEYDSTSREEYGSASREEYGCPRDRYSNFAEKYSLQRMPGSPGAEVHSLEDCSSTEWPQPCAQNWPHEENTPPTLLQSSEACDKQGSPEAAHLEEEEEYLRLMMPQLHSQRQPQPLPLPRARPQRLLLQEQGLCFSHPHTPTQQSPLSVSNSSSDEGTHCGPACGQSGCSSPSSPPCWQQLAWDGTQSCTISGTAGGTLDSWQAKNWGAPASSIPREVWGQAGYLPPPLMAHPGLTRHSPLRQHHNLREGACASAPASPHSARTAEGWGRKSRTGGSRSSRLADNFTDSPSCAMPGPNEGTSVVRPRKAHGAEPIARGVSFDSETLKQRPRSRGSPAHDLRMVVLACRQGAAAESPPQCFPGPRAAQGLPEPLGLPFQQPATPAVMLPSAVAIAGRSSSTSRLPRRKSVRMVDASGIRKGERAGARSSVVELRKILLGSRQGSLGKMGVEGLQQLAHAGEFPERRVSFESGMCRDGKEKDRVSPVPQLRQLLLGSRHGSIAVEDVPSTSDTTPFIGGEAGLELALASAEMDALASALPCAGNFSAASRQESFLVSLGRNRIHADVNSCQEKQAMEDSEGCIGKTAGGEGEENKGDADNDSTAEDDGEGEKDDTQSECSVDSFTELRAVLLGCRSGTIVNRSGPGSPCVGEQAGWPKSLASGCSVVSPVVFQLHLPGDGGSLLCRSTGSIDLSELSETHDDCTDDDDDSDDDADATDFEDAEDASGTIGLRRSLLGCRLGSVHMRK